MTNMNVKTRVLFSVICFIAYSIAPAPTCDTTFLRVERLSNDYTKGCYSHNTTMGLCFDIRPGYIRLSKKNNGENIVLFYEIGGKLFYYKILDHSFFGQNSSFASVTRDAPRGPDKLQAFLRNIAGSIKRIETSRENDMMPFQEIAGRLCRTQELRLLEDLLAALARNTSSVQILRPFYLMSIGIIQLTKQELPSSYRRAPVMLRKTAAPKDRFHRSTSCQDLRSDPHKNKCLGMCGPGCSCWKFICEDCCFHEGCSQHDTCCRHNALSTYCLTPFIYGFHCKGGYGGYPECIQSKR